MSEPGFCSDCECECIGLTCRCRCHKTMGAPPATMKHTMWPLAAERDASLEATVAELKGNLTTVIDLYNNRLATIAEQSATLATKTSLLDELNFIQHAQAATIERLTDALIDARDLLDPERSDQALKIINAALNKQEPK